MSQYPVFPWVLADHTSSELDLKNPVVIPLALIDKEDEYLLTRRRSIAICPSLWERLHQPGLRSS